VNATTATTTTTTESRHSDPAGRANRDRIRATIFRYCSYGWRPGKTTAARGALESSESIDAVCRATSL
jgi:hypothetical protein